MRDIIYKRKIVVVTKLFCFPFSFPEVSGSGVPLVKGLVKDVVQEESWIRPQRDCRFIYHFGSSKNWWELVFFKQENVMRRHIESHLLGHEHS